MQNASNFKLVFTLLGALVLLFLIAPLAGLILHSSATELSETLRDSEVNQSIALTLWTSMLATGLFALLAVPLAYLLARYSFWGKQLVLGIIDLPVVIPHSAAGIALLTVISRQGMLGKAGGLVGLEFPGTRAGIVMAMAFVSLPFLINAARDAFEAVPERLEKAALNLGASPVKVFFSISLPLAWRGIVSGLIMMFARGMSEFGAVVIVAYHPMITPVMIFERFGAFGLSYARPVAIVFIAVCLVFFIALRILSNTRRRAEG
ncbi:MAG: molybdenum ABC transporter permease [Bacteroidetes bacterium HGW-Bacteroidetes-4]|jgi:molybdate/tungstate transport system permease protein|nr:MAG: molybdenum ABC transporter permease [Bacteroidetes bacterium HGW-Bacteroidetes-4]